ncbi:hypothetical protein HAZT_HAZT009534, partial [Hyalella azteca]
ASKLARPKICYHWTVAEVQKWFKRHCSEYYALYAHYFSEHEINGKALVGLSQSSLLRLGITNAEHRDALCRQILKLRLKADIMEMREIQMRHRITSA